MAAKKFPITQFRYDIETLISEIEACMDSAPSDRDRESRFQQEVFRERCRQAKKLARRLADPNRSEWSRRSGDAYRIHESLKLSLAYFRNHQLT